MKIIKSILFNIFFTSVLFASNNVDIFTINDGNPEIVQRKYMKFLEVPNHDISYNELEYELIMSYKTTDDPDYWTLEIVGYDNNTSPTAQTQKQGIYQAFSALSINWISQTLPVFAGLGGGTSNAACIVKFLIKRKLNKNILNTLEKKIGTDISLFFFNRGFLKNLKTIKNFKARYKKIDLKSSFLFNTYILDGNARLLKQTKQPIDRFKLGIKFPYGEIHIGDYSTTFSDLTLKGTRVRGLHTVFKLWGLKINYVRGESRELINPIIKEFKTTLAHIFIMNI